MKEIPKMIQVMEKRDRALWLDGHVEPVCKISGDIFSTRSGRSGFTHNFEWNQLLVLWVEKK